MMQNFYNRFVKPLSTESSQTEREVVLNWLLVGILSLAIVALVDTTLSFIFSRETYLLNRIAGNVITVMFIAALYRYARYKHHQRGVASILTLLIGLFACFMVYQWGLLIPTGILLCGLAIVMAGILINARSALYVSLTLTIILIGLQYAKSQGSLQPDLAWMRSSSTAGDVIGFSAIFFIIALVSWLYNRQMELSLRRARRSEAALKRQKVILEITVQKRTQQLEAAHIEQMQELYRFAELGKLSTALFHDLANHLSTVNIDIEGLRSQDNKSEIMQRIHENVGHIDTVVQRVRQQIQGKVSIETFSVKDEINEVLKIMAGPAQAAGVSLELRTPGINSLLSCKGDTIRFRQLILNLIANGIEACPTKPLENKRVVITLERSGTALFISVSDNGKGIDLDDQTEIFKPFYTTKEKGVGIGLFIVKQIVEKDFKGTIELAIDNKQGATFIVKLPKSYYARKSSS